MRGSQPGRFRMMQYFMVTSLIAFGAVGIALYFLERSEQTFFRSVQEEQNSFFARAQAELVKQQKEAARGNLLMEHEADHVTLATLFSNVLWEAHFAPLVARAQQLSVDPCRAVAVETARQDCFAELGRRITALPGFAAADAAVHAAMRNTSVFKIKVYDLRGITVYSSELKQVGEDRAENLGWKSAVGGKPESELVHRDSFSALEGTVENRDLIQSYLPAMAPGGDRIIGVFEIYSDVTPTLQHMNAFSEEIDHITTFNLARVESAAARNQGKVETNSADHFAILAGLLLLLYAVLLVLARTGQRIVNEQANAHEQAALREHLWHREKMAALATMAANASHDIGNPLAAIAGLAEDIERADAAGERLTGQPRMVLEHVARITDMTRRITEFATARSETSEPIDLNAMVRSVCDFLGFDTRYHGVRFEMRLAERLPACVGIPEHLNEVLMSLLQAHAEACKRAAEADGRVLVETRARDEGGVISIGCGCGPAGTCAVSATDPRVESASRRMRGMGGGIALADGTTEIFLRRFPSGTDAK